VFDMRGSDLFSGSTTASANFTAGRPAGTINGVNSSFSIPQARRAMRCFSETACYNFRRMAIA